uniref:Follicle-stimulating hormone beta subunit n=1 Tax=Merluccius merluccius TaxID=8063 RepID=A0A1S6PCR8_MERME|nr:follicle-stimulating hormone beta subunit [Merluccius merluccius]
MQLVVMAALLAMTVGGQGCRFVCRPVNFTINATVCDKHRSIVTTICEGQCFQMDPIYKLYRPQQKTCNGDWSYETKHFEDCPVGFSYPVARSCNCAMCQGGNTQCEMFLDEVPTCHPLANLIQ